MYGLTWCTEMALQIDLVKETKSNSTNRFKNALLNWLESVGEYELCYTDHIDDNDYIVIETKASRYKRKVLVLHANNAHEGIQLYKLINQINRYINHPVNEWV